MIPDVHTMVPQNNNIVPQGSQTTTALPVDHHLIPNDDDGTTLPTSNCSSKHMPHRHLLPCTRMATQPHCSPCLHTTHHSEHTALHGNAFNPDIGEIAEYDALSCSSNGAHWQAANVAEIPCLAQGTPAVPSTNTMFFILVTALPAGCKATYLCIICAHCPQKTVPHCICWTIGGDWGHYDGNISTKTVNLTTANSLIALSPHPRQSA